MRSMEDLEDESLQRVRSMTRTSRLLTARYSSAFSRSRRGRSRRRGHPDSGRSPRLSFAGEPGPPSLPVPSVPPIPPALRQTDAATSARQAGERGWCSGSCAAVVSWWRLACWRPRSPASPSWRVGDGLGVPVLRPAGAGDARPGRSPRQRGPGRRSRPALRPGPAGRSQPADALTYGGWLVRLAGLSSKKRSRGRPG